MDPRILLFVGGKPYIEAAGLIITEDGTWPFDEAVELIWSQGVSTVTGYLVVETRLSGTTSGTATVTGSLKITVQLAGTSAGTSTITGDLSGGSFSLSGSIAGTSTVTGALVDLGTAGFEIPYPLGLGGVISVSLLATMAGGSSVVGALRQVHQLQGTLVGIGGIAGALTLTGSQLMAGTSNGVGSLIGELFVNAARNLAGISNGVATVTVTITNLVGSAIDPRSNSYLYVYLSVGVGFDPTDDASGHTGFVSQTFPDGHTRDDFWEYLYVYLNVGVGFDPTDDASSRPDFVSQTFPDGHTRDDFWEYLYLYLNVVRGFIQHGQLVIRPGYTRGPILPGARPPKQVP